MQKKQTKKVKQTTSDLNDYLYHLPNEGPGCDDLKQLYAWNFDDAVKAQDEWEAKNTRGRGPLFRWIDAQHLKELYNEYKAGNSAAIIEALYSCSMNSLPIPRWCEMAYITAYRKVRQYKAKSWDDVFGMPHPKGVHLDRKRLEWEKSLGVYLRIKNINDLNLFGNKEQEMEKGNPVRDHNGRIKWYNPSAIGENLFERVGKEFNIGKTLAEEYYYKWKNKRKIEIEKK